MKPILYFNIAGRILLLMIIGSIWTCITPELHDFLGDTSHNVVMNAVQFTGPEYTYNGIDWIWSSLHYWFFWGMFLLFCLTLLNSIMGVWNTIKKHYPPDIN